MPKLRTNAQRKKDEARGVTTSVTRLARRFEKYRDLSGDLFNRAMCRSAFNTIDVSVRQRGGSTTLVGVGAVSTDDMSIGVPKLVHSLEYLETVVERYGLVVKRVIRLEWDKNTPLPFVTFRLKIMGLSDKRTKQNPECKKIWGRLYKDLTKILEQNKVL